MKKSNCAIINIRNILKYLLALSLSCGFIVNLCGVKSILIEIFALILCRKKLWCLRDIILSAFFMFFLLIKCLPILGIQFVDTGFHGIHSHIVGMTVFLFVYLSSIPIADEIRSGKKAVYERVKLIFFVGYYFTIIKTLCYLYQNGRDAYRNGMISEDIFCAPHFFLFYSISFVFAYWIQIIKGKGNCPKKILGFMFNLFVVFSFNYMTQLLVTLIGLVIIMLFCCKKSAYYYLGCMIGICMTTILIGYLPYLIKLIAEMCLQGADNLTYYQRMMDISNFLSGFDGKMYDLEGRINLFMASYETFQCNFFFGIPFDLYNLHIKEGINVGGHFEWIDDLARYGIIGFILLMILIMKTLYVFCQSVKWEKSIFITILTTIILYGIFNPVLLFGVAASLLVCGILFSNDNGVRSIRRRIV